MTSSLVPANMGRVPSGVQIENEANTQEKMGTPHWYSPLPPRLLGPLGRTRH